jgi:hypothetical protein
MMNESANSKVSALKAAKKYLKKNDSPMKVKDLAKMVAEQVGDGLKYKDVQKWIADSDKFSVDGKRVSISSSKKRSSSKGPVSSSEQVSKKSKKDDEDNTNPSTDGVSSQSSIDSWRRDNKIVVKHAKDDEDGQKQTKIINEDPAYFPLTSFDACKAVIAEPLIRQATHANSFEKPSPIQAQAWPILMQKSKDGRNCDVVGIAETGSGKCLRSIYFPRCFALVAVHHCHSLFHILRNLETNICVFLYMLLKQGKQWHLLYLPLRR